MLENLRKRVTGFFSPPPPPKPPTQTFDEEGVFVEVLQPDRFRFSSETEGGGYAAVTLYPAQGVGRYYARQGASETNAEFNCDPDSPAPSGGVAELLSRGQGVLGRHNIEIPGFESSFHETVGRLSNERGGSGVPPHRLKRGKVYLADHSTRDLGSSFPRWHLQVFEVESVKEGRSHLGDLYSIKSKDNVQFSYEQGRLDNITLNPEDNWTDGAPQIVRDISPRQDQIYYRVDEELHQELLEFLVDAAPGNGVVEMMDYRLAQLQDDPGFQKLGFGPERERAYTGYRFLKSLEGDWARDCADLAHYMTVEEEDQVAFALVRRQRQWEARGLSPEEARKATLERQLFDSVEEGSTDPELIFLDDGIEVGEFFLGQGGT